VVLDDRYANKFAPLDSTTVYPKSGHALLYTTYDRWNEMPYKSYICLRIPFHLLKCWCHTSTNLHQAFDHHHESIFILTFLEWYDPLHIIMWLFFLTDHMTLLVNRSQLHLLFTVALVHRRQVFAQASPPHVVCRFKASNLPFTLATGSSMQSLVLVFSI